MKKGWKRKKVSIGRKHWKGEIYCFWLTIQIFNSFTIFVQMDCKHKNGWYEKGFCEDELQEYENAIKRLLFSFNTYQFLIFNVLFTKWTVI